MHSFYPLIITVLFTLVLFHLDPVVASTRAQQTRHARLRRLGPSPDTCVRLADDTTVVCCPEGEDCDTIRPIACDIAGQDAAAHPTAPVHTTNLTGALPACGSNDAGAQTCCPFGYACSDDAECVRSDGGASWTGSRSSVDTPPASFTSTLTISGSTASATALIVASSTVSVPIMTTPTSLSGGHASSGSSSSSSSSTKARTIGIAAGSAAGGLACAVGVIVFFWTRRRRHRRRRQRRAHTEANKPPRPKRPRRPETPFSETPPPLPPKEPHQIPKKKRRSILSWVPSVANRTPAELPATPVSFSAWDRQQPQWDQVGPRPPNPAHRPYPRDSISIEETHELEARWLPPQARHEVHYR